MAIADQIPAFARDPTSFIVNTVIITLMLVIAGLALSLLVHHPGGTQGA